MNEDIYHGLADLMRQAVKADIPLYALELSEPVVDDEIVVYARGLVPARGTFVIAMRGGSEMCTTASGLRGMLEELTSGYKRERTSVPPAKAKSKPRVDRRDPVAVE